MKRQPTKFVSREDVLTHPAAGWRIVPDETRKGLGGSWETLMAAPRREPVWFRLRRRLGLASEVQA